MKRIGILALLLLMMSLSAFENSFARGENTTKPVIVELFTSEGCSSCPPADELMNKLSQQRLFGNVEVIVLGEHVDYFDNLGWKDRFSSAAFTRRQRQCASLLNLKTVYTPQVVIDGKLQGVGNDANEMRESLGEATKFDKPADVHLAWAGAENLQIGVAYAGKKSPWVVLAITEDGESTKVGRGENGGRVLRHAPVVHQMRPVGKIENGRFALTMHALRDPEWNQRNLKAVVFVQDPDNFEILGAADIAYQ